MTACERHVPRRRECPGLAPLERFDHPNLHRRPTNILPAASDSQMDIIVAKECAGLRHDLRVTGAEMRRAFISGKLGRRAEASLRWLIPGMRSEFFPLWHSIGALTIFELARGMRVLGPKAGGYGGFLNQWADDPNKPLPRADDCILYLHDLSALPPAVLEIPGGDPRRRDRPSSGSAVFNLDGLRYSVPTSKLPGLRAARGIPPPRLPGETREIDSGIEAGDRN